MVFPNVFEQILWKSKKRLLELELLEIKPTLASLNFRLPPVNVGNWCELVLRELDKEENGEIASLPNPRKHFSVFSNVVQTTNFDWIMTLNFPPQSYTGSVSSIISITFAKVSSTDFLRYLI